MNDEQRIVQAETRLGAGEARQGVGEDRQTRSDRRQTEVETHQEATDGRLDAVELLAQANIRAMTEVRGLRDDIAKVDSKRGRDLNLFKAAMVLVLVLVVGVAFTVASNRPILNLIQSTVTPGGEIYEQNQARSNQLVFTLVTENDCRHRRAEAGLAPPPTTLVIKEGTAVATPVAPCGDLPDSPPGFQSPPRPQGLPPQEKPASGFNPVPYMLALAVGATSAVGAFIYRDRVRDRKREETG